MTAGPPDSAGAVGRVPGGRAEPAARDLRLLLPACACWAAVAAATPLAGRVQLALAAGCAGAAGIAALRGRLTRPARARPPASHAGPPAGARLASARARAPRAGSAGAGRRGSVGLAAVSLLAAAAGLAGSGLRAGSRESGPLHSLAVARAQVTMAVSVSGDPISRTERSLHGGSTYELVILDAQALGVSTGRRAWRMRRPVLLLATDPGWAHLLPSQHVVAAGRLLAPRPGDDVSAVLDVRGPPDRVRPPSTVQAAAGRLRAGLRRASAGLPGGAGMLLPGLVDGDTSALPSWVTTDFRRTGLTHLVAVSGTNLAIVAGVVLGATRRARAGPRAAATVTAVAVLGFVVLARPSPSVLRAAVMALLALAGLAAGRQRPALVGLAGGVLLLVLADPALARQPGFSLSVLASAGLLLFAPGWQRLLERSMPPRAAGALAVPAAAQLACAPVIAAIGGGLSLVAIPANLLAEPAVAPATLLGVAAAVCGPISPWLAHLCGWAAVPSCWWLIEVARVGAAVPAAAVGWPSGVAGAVSMAVLTLPVVALARRAILRR